MTDPMERLSITELTLAVDTAMRRHHEADQWWHWLAARYDTIGMEEEPVGVQHGLRDTLVQATEERAHWEAEVKSRRRRLNKAWEVQQAQDD